MSVGGGATMGIKEEGFRHELKFLISSQQVAALEARLLAVMQKDPHLKGDAYNIRSMYFDDLDHSCFYENENGTDPREKFRIRIYDGKDSFIRLELKMKSKGMTKKLQCRMTREQVDTVLRGESLADFDHLPALLKKFELQRMCRLLRPDVIVDYDRVPYIYALGNVRITIDSNVASSTQFDAFFGSHLMKRPVFQQDMVLLEVKYDELLPDYIKNLIWEFTAQRTTFSKFYYCKKFSG